LFEQAGAAGIILEDQVSPKRCGHFGRKTVIPGEEMVLKIRAAAAARRNPDFLIFVRTDAVEPHGFEEAVTRVNRCAEVGADVAFIEAPQTVEQLREIPRRVRLPAFVNMLSGGVTPILPANELEGLGYKLVVCPVETLMVCAKAVRELCRIWQTEGRVDGLTREAMTFGELKQFLGVEQHLRLREAFNEGPAPQIGE
jgi:2-methylisocitrate lyase-like PEP mutase family enzyme